MHYISTVAHHASLSHHGTASERSESVATLCSTAQAHIAMPTGSIPNITVLEQSQISWAYSLKWYGPMRLGD